MLYRMAYGCGLANALNKTADKIRQGKHLLSELLEQDQRRRGPSEGKDSASKEKWARSCACPEGRC